LLKAIIFDFDGVIANSEPLHLRAFQAVLADEAVTLTERDYYARYLGYDDAAVFQVIGAERQQQWDAAHVATLVARKAVHLEALERDVSILFPGAADVIRLAAAAVPIAIASGALGAEIRRVLDRSDLTRWFTAIVSAEDTAASKPAPEPYLRAVAQVSAALDEPLAARDCVAVEDSIWGIESARAAGLRTVGIAQTYAAEALATADLVIPSLRDLALDAIGRLCTD